MAVETKENSSTLKACGYCLKIFKLENKDENGCIDCRKEVDRLFRQGALPHIWPKTLEERIRKLEKRIETLEKTK